MSSNKSKTWKVLLVSLAAAVSFSMLSACSNNNNNNAEDSSTAVATYKGGTITANEFDRDQRIMKFLSPDQAQYLEIDALKEQFLKQEIAFEYLADKASEEAKKQAEKEADIQVKALKSGYGDTFESTLKEQNLKESDIRNYMLRVLTVFQDKLLQVTDEQVKQEFEANKGDFTVATLNHILIGYTDANGKERTTEEAMKLAKDIKAKLDGGADFASIAKEQSEDTVTKETGGEYKDKVLGVFPDQMKAAAQTLALNTVSDPIESDVGIHIIKVSARAEKTFDQLTDEQKQGIKNTIASTGIETFLDKDIDGVVEKINLPKSTSEADENGTNNSNAEPTEAPAASEAPTASEAPAPAATEAAK